jgi:hypothetical protein
LNFRNLEHKIFAFFVFQGSLSKSHTTTHYQAMICVLKIVS